MALVNVAELVEHARRHKYLIASFTAHTAETMQAIVTAAEANRAPVIIAIETPSVTFLHHDISLTVAQSIADRASVPVAIEAVCRSKTTAVDVPRKGISSLSLRSAQACLSAELPLEVASEVWLEAEQDCQVAELPPNVALIGIACDPSCGRTAAVNAMRKRFRQLRARRDVPLVIDGDIEWSRHSLCVLTALGAAKINYEQRLSHVIAGARSSAVKERADCYFHGVEKIYSLLVAQITQCLKDIDSTGRAADVIAFSAASRGKSHQNAGSVCESKSVHSKVAAEATLASPRRLAYSA